MFKFLPDDNPQSSSQQEENVKKNDALRQFEEITIQEHHHKLASQLPVTTTIGSSSNKTCPKIKYLKISDLQNSPQVDQDSNVKAILGSSSDLISGQYEGGFKLWECTFDLLTYMEEENPEIVSIEPNTSVLDLGCGSGLCGIYALAKGAATVVFQDYNVEVLNFLTIPNSIANFDTELLSQRARFFGGSWSSMNNYLNNDGQKEGLKFDLILSSETIYNTEYLQDFISLVDNILTPRGSLFLAAKTCYFGVGGGTKTFISLIKSKPNFAVDIVKVIKEGVQREVLRVYRKGGEGPLLQL